MLAKETIQMMVDNFTGTASDRRLFESLADQAIAFVGLKEFIENELERSDFADNGSWEKLQKYLKKIS